MANENHIILCARWLSDASGNHPDMDTPAGCRWQDITGQPAANLPCSPNVYLVEAWVTDGVYTAINGDARFIVLARQQYDTAAPETYLANNFDDKPTQTQLTNLKNLIVTRYPGVNDDALTEAGRAVFQAGVTRAEAIALLASRWQRFLKAVA